MRKHCFIGHLIEKYTKGKEIGLDVGIGKDNWEEFKNCKFIGVDIKKDNSCNIQLDLEHSLPFVDKSFDVAIAINTLNYIQKSRQLLNEINRILKNNAILICVVANEKSKNFPHKWEQKYLNRILEVSGFKSILLSDLKSYFYTKWFNYSSMDSFAIAKKTKNINEENKNTTQKDEIIVKYSKSYNIKTTHPD